MNDIDVHMLRSADENITWYNQCMNSLDGQPINIHHVNGVDGDMRRARYNGFMTGSAPYISFVDVDDYVMPEVYDRCLTVMQQNPHIGGVYTLSNHIKVASDGREFNKGLLHPYKPWSIDSCLHNITEIHQVVVMRRDLVIPLYDAIYDSIPQMVYSELYLYWALARIAPWMAIDFIGYNWRNHVNGCHHKKLPEVELRRCVGFIRQNHRPYLTYSM